MKFSDIPLYALENFLKDLFFTNTSTRSPFVLKNSYLRGSKRGLTSTKYQRFYGYVKKDEGYKKLTLNVNSKQWNTRTEDTKDILYIDVIDGDKTTFTQNIASDIWSISHNSGFKPSWINIVNYGNPVDTNNVEMNISDITITFSAPTSGYVEYGYVNNEDELYFKKNEEFYIWIKNILNKEELSFININKPFLYVGSFLQISNSYTQNWFIQHTGLKNFVINSLPEHNKTPGISNWFRYFFDRVYQKGYYAVQNINTLIDPDECPTDQLPYLAKFSNLNINNYNLEESTTRALIKSHIDLLKRKGTYYALEEIWNMIITNSENKMTIYDRWHSNKVVDEKLDPSLYFKDYPWKQFYSDMDPFLQVNSNFANFFNDNYPWALTHKIEMDIDYSDREIHKMDIPAAFWLINTKRIYINEPLITIFDTSFKKILVKDISRVDKNFFKIYISDRTETAGYAFIHSTD